MRNFVNNINVLSLKAVLGCSVLALAVSACSSVPGLNRLASENKEVVEVNKKDENRKSVLADEALIKPDEKFANTTIELPPPYVNKNWAQPMGDKDHTMHNLGATLAFDPLWRVKIGEGGKRRSPITAPPVVADGRIFTVDSAANISAFEASSGALLWRTKMTPDLKEGTKFYLPFSDVKEHEVGYGGGVAFDDNRLFVASGFGFVAALAPDTGEILWQEKTASPVRAAPTAANGNVYVQTIVNEFIALDQASGKVNWNFESFEESARILSHTSAAVSQDTVIAPFSPGEIMAMDALTGKRKWAQTVSRTSRRNALSNINDIAGSPVLDRGTVFAISNAGQFSAIELETGKELWSKPISGIQMPWVAGDYIYVMDSEYKLICMTRDAGDIIWTKEFPRSTKTRFGNPELISYTGPIIAGGQVILVSSIGELMLLSPQDGTVTQKRVISESSKITPIIANETLYILSETGHLMAYK